MGADRTFYAFGWRYAPVGALVTALVSILYLALMPAAEAPFAQVWDKLNHGFAFLVLALLLDLSRPRRAFSVGDWALLLTYGFLIEALQGLTATRYFSWLDLLADGGGVAAYLLLTSVGVRVRTWYLRMQP